MSLVELDYTGCENCKHEGKEVFEYPCTICRNNFCHGTKEYEAAPFLWESPDTPDNKDNQVIHPSHYNQGGIECIDAMVSAFGEEAVGYFCKLNAFKYIWRADHKNGFQDIEKAIWYLNKYGELFKVE